MRSFTVSLLALARVFAAAHQGRAGPLVSWGWDISCADGRESRIAPLLGVGFRPNWSLLGNGPEFA